MWLCALLAVGLLTAVRVEAMGCAEIKVENATYNPSINGLYHQSNYVCRQGESSLIYYLYQPPRPAHDNSYIESRDTKPNVTGWIPPEKTTTQSQDNYFLFYYSGKWRIGLMYCSTAGNYARVDDNSVNPIDIGGLWKEREDEGLEWIDSPFLRTKCGTTLTNQQLYGIAIGVITGASLVFIAGLACRKRRQWDRLQEEECEESEEDPAPFVSDPNPPSYAASVATCDIPPPLYDDLTGCQDGSSPPPFYQASTEEPPAYEQVLEQDIPPAPVHVEPARDVPTQRTHDTLGHAAPTFTLPQPIFTTMTSGADWVVG